MSLSSVGCVLVVDDEPFLAESIRDAVRELGHSCDAVSGGEEALLYLGSRAPSRPCLVLVDWMMPGTDGGAFARRAREAGLADPRTLVVLTASRGLLPIEPAVRAVFFKPLSLAGLEAIVSEACVCAGCGRRR